MSAALCRSGTQHHPGSRWRAIVGYLWRRVPDGGCASTREMRHGLARRALGRRLRFQPQVAEDLLDHRSAKAGKRQIRRMCEAAQPQVSAAEARALARYVLSVK